MKSAEMGKSESAGEGYDTNSDTKKRPPWEDMPQLVESMVELSGIEPLASSLRKRGESNLQLLSTTKQSVFKWKAAGLNP
jgi:hypothetical protein